MTNTSRAIDSETQLTPLVEIPGGEFLMGSDDHYPEESPVHPVNVDTFQIEIAAVTNDQYAKFVEETGYITVAERPLSAEEFPHLPPENLVPGSMLFRKTSGPVDLRYLSQWWVWKHGVSWKTPYGPKSNLEGIGNHPVVHIAFEDAENYAFWAGRKLPTEAQWEKAARGGLEGKEYSWGNEKLPNGKRMCKKFEGAFPWKSRPADGYQWTAPIMTFPPNGYGLYDITGNTWEWTQDWYKAEHDSPADNPCCVPNNPRGGDIDGSYDPNQPQFHIPRKVLKGGSFLCADEYCKRYRPAARRPQMIDTGMSHIGFRCVVTPDS